MSRRHTVAGSGLGVNVVPQLADIYSHFHYIAREYVFVHSAMGRQNENLIKFPPYSLWSGKLPIR